MLRQRRRCRARRKCGREQRGSLARKPKHSGSPDGGRGHWRFRHERLEWIAATRLFLLGRGAIGVELACGDVSLPADQAAQRGVPAVLDCVVGATWHHFRDFRKAVAMQALGQNDELVLLRRPGAFFDVGVEMVVPTLADLLGSPATVAMTIRQEQWYAEARVVQLD